MPDSAVMFATSQMFRMLFAGLLAGMGALPIRAAGPATALQARYVALQEQLTHNAYQRPLFLDSTEAKEGLKGDLFVVIDHPFATVSQALQVLEHWGDILILHLNVKGCRVVGQPAGRTLLVSIGRKNDEPLDQAYPVSFGFRVAAAQADYLHILLHADTGPMGSRNYEIALEAVPLKAGRTFIHLAYSYDYGVAARLAMKAYLATIGSDKVGFSATAQPAGGAAVLVSGVRGVVERNTMRYYLAIEAFLGALAVPAADRLEKRLHDWFAATEQFPLQLHELDEAVYLAMKRNEVRRQETGPDPAG